MVNKYRCKKCGCKFAENTFPCLVVCPNCHCRWVQYEGVLKSVLLLLLVVALSLTMVLAQETIPPLEIKFDMVNSDVTEFTLMIQNPADVEAEFSFAPKGFSIYETNESTNIVTTVIAPAIYTLQPGEKKTTTFKIESIPSIGHYRGYITMTIKAGTQELSIDREVDLEVTMSEGKSPVSIFSNTIWIEVAIAIIVIIIIILIIYKISKREKLKKFVKKGTLKHGRKN